MINPILFNASYIQHEIYYVNESINKSNVEDFTNTTENGWTSELNCIDPGGPPCCIEPISPGKEEECLEKTNR